MSIAVPQIHDLQTLVAVMQSAKEQGANMHVWDRDIKAVEAAITFIKTFSELADD